MRFAVMFFTVATLMAVTVQAQSGPPAPMPVPLRRPMPRAVTARPRPTMTMLEQTAEEIEEARPEVGDEMLLSDEGTVQRSTPAVRRIFSKRGYTEAQTNEAILYGWKELRVNRMSPEVELSSKQLVDFVSGLGMLTIKSDPPGATIEIDGKRHPHKTGCNAWPSAGVHRIKLSLPGYETVEDTCTVEEETPATFEKTLRRLGKSQ